MQRDEGQDAPAGWPGRLRPLCDADILKASGLGDGPEAVHSTVCAAQERPGEYSDSGDDIRVERQGELEGTQLWYAIDRHRDCRVFLAVDGLADRLEADDQA